MKMIKALFVLMSVFLMMGSASAETWSDIGSFDADDSTPNVPFKIYADNASYTCNMYLNLSGTWTAAGTVEATNNTLSSITCNYTLSPNTVYQYNITAANTTDDDVFYTSSTYTVKYSPWRMLATMVTDMVDIFTAMTSLIIVLIVLLVVISIGVGLTGGFGKVFSTIFDALRFRK